MHKKTSRCIQSFKGSRNFSQLWVKCIIWQAEILYNYSLCLVHLQGWDVQQSKEKEDKWEIFPPFGWSQEAEDNIAQSQLSKVMDHVDKNDKKILQLKSGI